MNTSRSFLGFFAELDGLIDKPGVIPSAHKTFWNNHLAGEFVHESNERGDQKRLGYKVGKWRNFVSDNHRLEVEGNLQCNCSSAGYAQAGCLDYLMYVSYNNFIRGVVVFCNGSDKIKVLFVAAGDEKLCRGDFLMYLYR